MTLIIPDALDLRVRRVGDLVYLNHNGGTKAFDLIGARLLIDALVAVTSGQHDLVLTETAARLEAERAARVPQPQSERKLTTLNLADLGL